MISAQTRELIVAHARSEYPKESCGLIIGGVYQPCFNYASEPLQDFVIAGTVMLKAVLSGKLEAVVHSHPDGPLYPSKRDMQSQIDTGVPWIIIPLDEEREGDFIMWGDGLPIPPILGREFVHGVTDCYSVIRDAYRLGKDELAKQGVDWPFEPILLPEFAREDCWWNAEDGSPAENMYVENFAKAGFVEVPRDNPQPGDVFMTKVRSTIINHAGLVMPGGMVMHQFPMRLSRREGAPIWVRAADMIIRRKEFVDA